MGENKKTQYDPSSFPFPTVICKDFSSLIHRPDSWLLGGNETAPSLQNRGMSEWPGSGHLLLPVPSVTMRLPPFQTPASELLPLLPAFAAPEPQGREGEIQHN